MSDEISIIDRWFDEQQRLYHANTNYELGAMVGIITLCPKR
jgi:hypothetical protein